MQLTRRLAGMRPATRSPGRRLRNGGWLRAGAGREMRLRRVGEDRGRVLVSKSTRIVVASAGSQVGEPNAAGALRRELFLRGEDVGVDVRRERLQDRASQADDDDRARRRRRRRGGNGSLRLLNDRTGRMLQSPRQAVGIIGRSDDLPGAVASAQRAGRRGSASEPTPRRGVDSAR